MRGPNPFSSALVSRAESIARHRTELEFRAQRRAAAHVAGERGDAAVKWITLVRAEANRGELRLADAACLAALEHPPLEAELHFCTVS